MQDWSRDGFASSRATDFEGLSRAPPPSGGGQVRHGVIDRVDCSLLTVSDFIERYEKACRPVVIRGVPEAEGWSAPQRWAPDELVGNPKLRSYTFKCGEDDDGRSIRVTIKHFLQ